MMEEASCNVGHGGKIAVLRISPGVGSTVTHEPDDQGRHGRVPRSSTGNNRGIFTAFCVDVWL
jgi:hypothetical protein